MLSPSSTMNSKNRQTLTTPLSCLKTSLKPPSRKLWKKENVTPQFSSNNWNRFQQLEKEKENVTPQLSSNNWNRFQQLEKEKENVTPQLSSNNWNRFQHLDKEKWDLIDSPQFVDFSSVPDTNKSFSNRITVIVSTPKPNVENKNLSYTVNEDALVASLNNISVSGITCETPTGSYNDSYSNGEETEKFVVHNASVKERTIIENPHSKIKNPQGTIVNPFNFDVRGKVKQKQIKSQKPEENEKWVFRANPIPMFLKKRLQSMNNNNEKNEKIEGDVSPKKQGASLEKPRKNVEVWKKPPFMPSLPKRNLEKPKMPPLSTAIRANERKRFDDIIKENDKRKEELKQLEIVAKKKQEEKEIAQWRKQLVHKAQPIRRYKSNLPPVTKRPLTDAVSPLMYKRRRHL